MLELSLRGWLILNPTKYIIIQISEKDQPGAPGLAVFETWDSTAASILGSSLADFSESNPVR
jgi:hypothetical protein